MSESWVRCIDTKSWDWLDDLDWKTPDEVKQLRSTLNKGQTFVRVLDQCREHLAVEGWKQYDSLEGHELKRFILLAHKHFSRIADAIQQNRDIEGL